MTRREWFIAIGKALVYGAVTVVLLIAVAIVLSGPSQRERTETNRNVRLLVDEARKNREALCLAVIRNPANAARDDPRLIELCREIGVAP